MNYFEKYGKRQLEIAKKWIAETPWLNEIVQDIEEDSTSFHDVRFKTSINPDRWYTIEVKEDERFWFDRTENVGLDAISSFEIVSNKDIWLQNGNKGAWIEANDFKSFTKDIKVKKWGKLFTCDADIQLFFVEGRLLKAYNNSKIVNKEFSDYLTSNYRLRINDKSRYNIRDSWMSATYLFKPLKDENFIKMEIKNLKDFEEL